MVWNGRCVTTLGWSFAVTLWTFGLVLDATPGFIALSLVVLVALGMILRSNRQVKVRVGAVETAVGTVETSVTEVKTTTEQVQSSVGHTNGESLSALMAELKTFAEYTHQRNHDMIGLLTTINAAVPALIDALREHRGLPGDSPA